MYNNIFFFVVMKYYRIGSAVLGEEVWPCRWRDSDYAIRIFPKENFGKLNYCNFKLTNKFM